MSNILKLTVLALLSVISTHAMAQNTISIQSTLKNISGEPVPDGMQSITFKLYTQLEGGTELWDEMADVEVVSGIYSHELGSVEPLVTGDFGQQLYLGVTVNNKELAPRTKLGFAPYAMAVNALAANGESASFGNDGTFIVSDSMSAVSSFANEAFSNFSYTGVAEAGTVRGDKIGVAGANTASGDVDIAVGVTNTGIGGDAGNLKFYVANNIAPKMTVKVDGRVGIGTIDPVTTLHVLPISLGAGSPGNPAHSYFRVFTQFADLGTTTPGQAFPFIANFEGSVLARSFFASDFTTWSDKRLKTELQKSNAKSDLVLLNKIEVTEYNHIDKINNDTRRHKKVIAQQVADVLPNAITKSRSVIPNVYEVAKEFNFNNGVLSVQTKKAHDFLVGDKIDLKTLKSNIDNVEVIEVYDAHTFSVKIEEKPENVFVYGKYVDDLMSVDYDAIAMLNVSASQEMYRMIMDLQKANNDLIKENEALKSSTANIEDRLSTLEAMLVKSYEISRDNSETSGK